METKARGNRSSHSNVAAVELYIPAEVPLLKDASEKDCAEAISKGHEISELGGQMSVLGALIAGVALAKAKLVVPHGEFGAWKERNVPHIRKSMVHYYSQYTDLAFTAAKKSNFRHVGNFDFSSPETFELPAKGDRPKWEALYKVIHEATDGKTVTGLLRAHGIIRDASRGGLMCERDADGKLIRKRRRTKAELEHEQAVKEATLAAKGLQRTIALWHESKFWNHVENADLLLSIKEELWDLHHEIAQSCAARKLKRGAQ